MMLTDTMAATPLFWGWLPIPSVPVIAMIRGFVELFWFSAVTLRVPPAIVTVEPVI